MEQLVDFVVPVLALGALIGLAIAIKPGLIVDDPPEKK